MSLLIELGAIVGDAFAAAGVDRSFGEVAVSQRPELAQFQCNGALAASKNANMAPRDLAAKVVEQLESVEMFAAVEVAGPGFINITLTDHAIAHHMQALDGDGRLGLTRREPRKIIVDYGGPNVAKELHVGHLRPAIIGESLKRILLVAGHDVTGDVHLGDWGAPIGQLIVELQSRSPELLYFDDGYDEPYPDEAPVTVEELNEMYPVASARAADDPAFATAARDATFELQNGRPGYRALWAHFRRISVEAMRLVYADLGVHFERWYGEATVHDRIGPLVDRLTASGAAYKSDGAVVVDVAQEGDTRDFPPVVLVKSDGGYLYTTTDLATLEDRADDGFDEVLYLVDVRQADHFESVFRVARKGRVVPDKMVLDHSGNGTVNGADGRPLKTRDGNLPLLRELVAESVELAKRRMDERNLAEGYPAQERAEVARKVGLAALKYGDLNNHRTSDYVFDLERFTSFDGKTGPYLLYGAVRMQSILRQADQWSIVSGPIKAPVKAHDRNLMLRLTRFPEVIERAIERRAPNNLAEHAYDVVSEFNRFYEGCRILDENDPHLQSSWLALVALTLRQLRTLLELLVIEVPERM